MVKRHRKNNKLLRIYMWVVGIIISLAIGGLFIAGVTNVFPLQWIPTTVNKIIGWTIIVSTILGAIFDLMK